jgi:hypothetical protein
MFPVELERALLHRNSHRVLALRFRADTVTYFPELFWSFEQTPFSLLSLLISCRWIAEPVDLVARQVVGLQAGFRVSLLG